MSTRNMELSEFCRIFEIEPELMLEYIRQGWFDCIPQDTASPDMELTLLQGLRASEVLVRLRIRRH